MWLSGTLSSNSFLPRRAWPKPHTVQLYPGQLRSGASPMDSPQFTQEIKESAGLAKFCVHSPDLRGRGGTGEPKALQCPPTALRAGVDPLPRSSLKSKLETKCSENRKICLRSGHDCKKIWYYSKSWKRPQGKFRNALEADWNSSSFLGQPRGDVGCCGDVWQRSWVRGYQGALWVTALRSCKRSHNQ